MARPTKGTITEYPLDDLIKEKKDEKIKRQRFNRLIKQLNHSIGKVTEINGIINRQLDSTNIEIDRLKTINKMLARVFRPVIGDNLNKTVMRRRAKEMQQGDTESCAMGEVIEVLVNSLTTINNLRNSGRL